MTTNAPRPNRPWDTGLQIERTTLAWLRTALAFVVGLLVLLRLIAYHSLLAAVVSAIMLLPLALGITGLSWRRHLRGERQLHAARPVPSGRQPAAVTLLAILAGVTALLYTLLW